MKISPEPTITKRKMRMTITTIRRSVGEDHNPDLVTRDEITVIPLSTTVMSNLPELPSVPKEVVDEQNTETR